jgi:hypothetical protein
MAQYNQLGYISYPVPGEVIPQSYTTAERLALTNQRRGQLVHDRTLGINYYWDGTQWLDTSMTPVELKNLTPAEVNQLTNINNTAISAAQWGYVGAMDQQVGTASQPTFQSLRLEETGVGIDTITIEAPAIVTASYTLTLPADDGNADEILRNDGAGILTWVNPSTLVSHTTLPNLDAGTYGDGNHTNLVPRHLDIIPPTVNDDTAYKVGSVWVDTVKPAVHINSSNTNGAAVWHELAVVDGVRTYTHEFVLAGDDAPVVNPTIVLNFGTSAFSARIRLLSADHADDRNIALLNTEAVGGKWIAGAGTPIITGNTSVIGHVNATFSLTIATTATSITLTKTANVTQGSYPCNLFVDVQRGTLISIVDGLGATLKTWT